MAMPPIMEKLLNLQKKVDELEAWRYMRIGGVVDVTAPDLPLENCMWADGSLALFDLWPELKAKYEKGGFSGLLLPYNCSDEDKKTYPLKWVPDSANPTGLFVPRLIGLFARYCGHGEQVGSYHRDEIRNIRARLEPSLHQSDRFPLLASGGEAAMVEMAPVKKAVPMCYTENTTFAGYACGVDASLSVPTGPENVPQHYGQPVALYLGVTQI